MSSSLAPVQRWDSWRIDGTVNTVLSPEKGFHNMQIHPSQGCHLPNLRISKKFWFVDFASIVAECTTQIF